MKLTVQEGATVSFYCRNALHVSWLYNEKKKSGPNTVTNEDRLTITISPVNSNSAGHYACYATHVDYGNFVAVGKLTVKSK